MVDLQMYMGDCEHQLSHLRSKSQAYMCKFANEL